MRKIGKEKRGGRGEERTVGKCKGKKGRGYKGRERKKTKRKITESIWNSFLPHT
jgi:hypothetical protein